jgi:hypothetical protein
MDKAYHITLRLPPDLASRIRKLALQEQRSLNAEIIVLLLAALGAQEQPSCSPMK